MTITETDRGKWAAFGAVMFSFGGVIYLVFRPMVETPEQAMVGILAFFAVGLIVMWYHINGPVRWWSWQAWKHAWRDARGEGTGDQQ